jgi:outer membrane protein TolC
MVEAARAKQSEAKAAYIPTVNADAVTFTGFSGSSGSNLGVRGMVASPFVDHYAAAVEGSWSALEFLRIGPRVSAARAEEAAVEAEKAGVERDTGLAVVDAYERVLSLEATIASVDEDLSSRRAALAVLETQAASGIVAGVEVLQNRAGLARAVADRTRLVAEAQAARAGLIVLTADPRFSSASLELDALTPRGGMPETRMAVARRDQADRLRDVAGRELTPRLVVSGSAGYANPSLGKDTGYYAIGAAVIVPLTSFISEEARQEVQARNAEAQADAAEARRQQVELEIASLRATVAGVTAGIPAADASERAARAALDALDARVKAGAARAVETEAARALVVEAQSTAAVLRIRARTLQARLALLGG